MLFVLAAGAASRGSRRWIDIGIFTFQPSEFGKVLFVLALAGLVADRARSITRTGTVLRILAFGLAPIFLVFIQPDIGTALVYAAALAAVLFIAGVRWLHLGILGLIAVLTALAVLWALPAAGVNILKPYQAKRLTGFTHPDVDPQGDTYNLRQSITAVGAGGLRGRGVQGATQTRLNYLPEHATDFAFASLSEEHGFFGASILHAPLPARRLARPEDRHERARPLLCDRRRWNRIHVSLSGLRQQCNDDGNRADHRHPAAVRLGRRLVDDHELPGDGSPPGDLHAPRRTEARVKAKQPLAALSRLPGDPARRG